MKEKKLLLTILLFRPCISQAYSSESTSYWYTFLYFTTVIPVILWIANLVVFIRTINKKEVKTKFFWSINIISILLALFSSLPILVELPYSTFNHFSDYGFVLIVFVLGPLAISAYSIKLRQNQDEHTDSENADTIHEEGL